MKDLELMRLLEESGYEPSIDNLIALKEALENGEVKILTEVRKSVKELAKKGWGSKEWDEASEEMRDRAHAYEAGKKGDIETGAKHKVDAFGSAKKLPKEDTGNHDNKHRRTVANNIKTAKAQIEFLDKIGISKKDTKAYVARNIDSVRDELAKTHVKESVYSDYELYKILDENGYTTTTENLDILKEGLDSGRFIIEDNN